MEKNFGSWFKELYLDKYGITAYKLSKDTGIPNTLISKLINNQITLSVEKAILIAYYFGISPDELLSSAMFYEVRKKRHLPEIEKKLQQVKPLQVNNGN